MAETTTGDIAMPQLVGTTEGNLGEAERTYPSSQNVNARFRLYDFAVEFDLPIDQNPDKRGQVLDYAEEHFDVKDGNVLELGCSDGTDLLDLRLERGYTGELIGIDTNGVLFVRGEHTIAAHGIKNVVFKEGRAEDLSEIPDGSLRSAMGWYMMYETDPVEQALAQIWDKLEPGGLFLITTHNDFNIPIHRLIERLISMFSSGELTEPEIRSKRFWMETARSLLAAQGFEKVQEFRGMGPVKIPGEHREVYRDSLYTRELEFDPPPHPKIWKKIFREVIDPYIDSEIEKRGYILDFWDRWGAVYQKPQETDDRLWTPPGSVV